MVESSILHKIGWHTEELKNSIIVESGGDGYEKYGASDNSALIIIIVNVDGKTNAVHKECVYAQQVQAQVIYRKEPQYPRNLFSKELGKSILIWQETNNSHIILWKIGTLQKKKTSS